MTWSERLVMKWWRAMRCHVCFFVVLCSLMPRTSIIRPRSYFYFIRDCLSQVPQINKMTFYGNAIPCYHNDNIFLCLWYIYDMWCMVGRMAVMKWGALIALAQMTPMTRCCLAVTDRNCSRLLSLLAVSTVTCMWITSLMDCLPSSCHVYIFHCFMYETT